MNLPPVAILYTQDQEFVRRAKAFLRMMGQVRHVAEPDRLDAVLQQTGPAVLLIDLHAKESRELINQIQSDWPEVLIIAFGAPHSDPLREAEESGIYAAEDLQLDRNRFQALVGRAFDLLRVMQENRELRDQSTPSREPVAPPPSRLDMTTERYSSPSLQMLRFPRVFRRVDDVDTLLENVVEGVADAAAVSRVGIFRAFARAIAIGCAPVCAVCPKVRTWNSESAIRSFDGSNCTRISSVAQTLHNRSIQRSAPCFAALSILLAPR